MRKLRLFIGSSVESLPIAEAINVNLDHDFEVTIWKNGTFKLSSSTIEDLTAKSSSVDFALFIFAPDDIATIRDRVHHVVRDNVIFELGLFVGAIGKSRCFILKPRGIDLHLPTDLLGMTPADFEPNRSDNDLVSATNRACSLLKAEATRLGPIGRSSLSGSAKLLANPANYALKRQDYFILAACLESHAANPTGLPFHKISNDFRNVSDAAIQISLVKLERMGFVSKSVEADERDGYPFYSYSITDTGIDEILRNEDVLRSVLPDSAVDLDQTIPF